MHEAGGVNEVMKNFEMTKEKNLWMVYFSVLTCFTKCSWKFPSFKVEILRICLDYILAVTSHSFIM